MSNNVMDRFVPCSTDEFEEHVIAMIDVWERSGCKVLKVPYAESSPGTGKTSTARRIAYRVAESMGLSVSENNPTPGDDQFGFIVSQFGNYSEEVISGLPWADKEKGLQMRAMAQDFPRSGRGIWLIDEPFQTPYAWRFVAQVVSDRRIGSHFVVPPGWFIILAGNSAKDRAGTIRIPTHMQNRICMFRTYPSVDGALRTFEYPATPEISVYLRWFGSGVKGARDAQTKGKLDMFDPRNDGPYATPRSWSDVNTLVHFGMNPDDHFVLFQGYLGTDTATDLRTCYRAVADLPNINEMLDKPDDYSVIMESMHANDPTKTAALAFVILRRLDHDRDTDAAGRAIKLFQYAGLEQTAAFIAVADDIDQRHRDGKQTLDHPEYARFVAKYPHIIAN